MWGKGRRRKRGRGREEEDWKEPTGGEGGGRRPVLKDQKRHIGSMLILFSVLP